MSGRAEHDQQIERIDTTLNFIYTYYTAIEKGLN
jgi:hypothetical protein